MSITVGLKLNMVVGVPEENHDTDIDSDTMRGGYVMTVGERPGTRTIPRQDKESVTNPVTG